MSKEAEPGSHLLATRGLVKRFGKRTVVRGVDLTVRGGEIVGLLGPNGAGKTTSFYIMVGLIPATEGEVTFDEKSIRDWPMHRRARLGIGYLPQEPSVFRKLTVAENLHAIAQTLPVKKTERRQRVDELIEELGLGGVLRQKAFTLSGGERRRLEIARALLTRPRFLLMDEPFSGVDPISVSEVQKIVLQMRSRGIGVLITDHNVRETLRIVDRAYLLHEGTVLAEGDSDSLVHNEKSRQFYLGEDFAL